MFSIPKIRIFLISGLLLVLGLQCKKSDRVIPNVSVHVVIDEVTLSTLGVGSSMIYAGNAGIRGIIVYRSDLYEYKAYERLCTNYPNDTCTVKLDTDGLTAVCPCCGSEFSMPGDGAVIKSPARWPLKEYQTTYLGGRLYIDN